MWCELSKSKNPSMKKYKASVKIMPRAELLDPQGKTVAKNMNQIDVRGVEDVRIGKFIEIMIDAESAEKANASVEEACKKLLANLIMEQYEFEVEEVETQVG